MKLYWEILWINIVVIQATTHAPRTPTPDELLATLDNLKNTVTETVDDKTNEFIADFRDYLLQANSDREITCLSERFAAFYSKTLQYLLSGFSQAENRKIEFARNDVLTCGQNVTPAVIDEVNRSQVTLADHMDIWASYLEPISQAQLKLYEHCLGEEKSKPFDRLNNSN